MGAFMVRLDDTLHDEVRSHADMAGMTMADLVRDAVEWYLGPRTEVAGCAHETTVATSVGEFCSACRVRL